MLLHKYIFFQNFSMWKIQFHFDPDFISKSKDSFFETTRFSIENPKSFHPELVLNIYISRLESIQANLYKFTQPNFKHILRQKKILKKKIKRPLKD